MHVLTFILTLLAVTTLTPVVLGDIDAAWFTSPDCTGTGNQIEVQAGGSFCVPTPNGHSVYVYQIDPGCDLNSFTDNNCQIDAGESFGKEIGCVKNIEFESLLGRCSAATCGVQGDPCGTNSQGGDYEDCCSGYSCDFTVYGGQFCCDTNCL